MNILKRKGFLTKLLICVLVISLSGGMAFGATIPADAAGSPQAAAITALIEAGVMEGYPDGTFRPLNNLTRAEASAIIVRAINPPTAELVGTPTQNIPPSGFPDMQGHWADRYVSFAVRHGIVTGYPDGTFKPSNNVTPPEMFAMLLRAIGLTNAQIGTNWPGDFIARAETEGISAGLPANIPTPATREDAARMVYNVLDTLIAKGESMEEEVGDIEDTEPGTPGTGPNVPWNMSDLQFQIGRVSADMTTFAGIPISRNVSVYAYGTRNNFRRGMELPTSLNQYREDTIHKFRSTNTPAFYIVEGGQITLMIVPIDAGFTGRIYGVINGTSVTVNERGDRVNSIHMLVAGRQVAWMTANEGINAPSEDAFLNGEVFELIARNGIITSGPFRASDAGSHADFRELTPVGEWAVVENVSRGLITLDNGRVIDLMSEAAIYTLAGEGRSYTVGRPEDIREGSRIRAFAIAPGQGSVAAVVTVWN